MSSTRRNPTRAVHAGPVQIGGGAPISVQSMCATHTQDVAATVRFLAGPDARYITGQTIHVNGGAFLG